DAARLRDLPQFFGEEIADRKIEQGLAAEQRQDKPRRPHLVEARLDPRYELGRGLERHLRGVLVVVAVVALNAVIAREVALQRRQDRDAQLVRVFTHIAEELFELRALRRTVGNQKAMLG